MAWKKSGNLLGCTLLTSALALSAASVCAQADRSPVALDERTVLLDWASAGQGQSDFTFDAAAELEYGFTLAINPSADDTRPYVQLNGAGIGIDPLANGELAVFYIPPAFVNAGESNAIAIRNEAGEPLAVDSAVLFELEAAFEEVHFAQVFGPRARNLRAAPPMHSSQNNYDVTHYDLTLDIDITSRDINSATTLVTADSLVDDLSQVALDFDIGSTALNIDLDIDSVAMVPAVVGLTYSYDSANDWLIVNIPAAAQPDTGQSFTIEVNYHGVPPSSAGAFGLNSYNHSTQPTGEDVVYSFNEPYSARSWYPCKDITADKADSVDIRITVPDPYEVVTNGLLVGTTPDGSGNTEYHWQHNYPVATYLMAFVATEFAYAEGTYTAQNGIDTMMVGHYVYLNSTGELAAVNNTINVMDFFAATFGEYPFLDEKYVTMTWGGGFGMEHQTATSINNGNLAFGGESRRNVHELAHQWFGDQVTPVSFDHLWLNEGWATYCEALYREHDNGVADYHNAVDDFIDDGINDSTPMVNSNADAFQSSLVYRKGAVVLHMLRHVVGDAAFFQGTRDYLAADSYGIVDTDDFQNAIEAASSMDLDDFFNDWVYGTSRPSYIWTWHKSGDDLVVNIEQVQGAGVFEMPIDIVVELSGGGTHTFVADMTQRDQEFIFDATGLNIVDADFDPDDWIYKGSVSAPPPPQTPTLLSVTAQGQVTWSSGGGSTDGFRVYTSTDLDNWTLEVDEGTLNAAATSTIVSATHTASDAGVFVAVAAVSSGGLVSAWSDVYGFADYSAAGRRFVDGVLVVEGYDRWNSQGRGENHPFGAWHGQALGENQISYESCANEEVGVNFDLGDYDAVVWILGEESTVRNTFNTGEQALVEDYLEGGGKLFVTGAEIGWDLGRVGSGNYSPNFYNNYLKAIWEDDDSEDYTVSATGAITPATLAFDDGDDGIYFADWPDVISPNGGSVEVYEYNSSETAAVLYNGTFGGGTEEGGVFYMGFGFETIVSEQDRADLMLSVMSQWDIPSSVGDWSVLE